MKSKLAKALSVISFLSLSVPTVLAAGKDGGGRPELFVMFIERISQQGSI